MSSINGSIVHDSYATNDPLLPRNRSDHPSTRRHNAAERTPEASPTSISPESVTGLECSCGSAMGRPTTGSVFLLRVSDARKEPVARNVCARDWLFHP